MLVASLVLTLKLALVTSLLFLLLGAPLAWLLAKRQFRGKGLIESLLFLPLVLPPTVLGFYLLLLLSPHGPLAPLGLAWAFDFKGMVVASLVFNTPFVLTAYKNAFSAVDNSLLDTARTLGAGFWKRTFGVILPLSWRGLLGGTLLAFAHTVGEFGVVLMVGGSIPGKTQVLSIYLYDLTQALRFEEANRLALGLLLGSFVLLSLARSLEKGSR